MARPDDDHVPVVLRDANGELLAVAHMSPDAGPEVLEHLRAVVEAAKRIHEALPGEEREEMARRQEASRERCRERLIRLGIRTAEET